MQFLRRRATAVALSLDTAAKTQRPRVKPTRVRADGFCMLVELERRLVRWWLVSCCTASYRD